MTVSSTTNKVSYSLSGSQMVFAYNFKIFEEGDLKVILRDSEGSETELVLNSDYTVSGAGDENGGSITTAQAYASGNTLVIIRELALKQETDYSEGGSFPAKSHENVADRLTMMTQQLKEQIDRALRVASSSAITGLELPDPEDGKALVGNAAGDGFINALVTNVMGAITDATDYASKFKLKELLDVNIIIPNQSGTAKLLGVGDGSGTVTFQDMPSSALQVKKGVFSRNLSLAEGEQQVSGVGFEADIIFFTSTFNSNHFVQGYDSGLEAILVSHHHSWSGSGAVMSGYSIFASADSSNYQRAKITSKDSDSFTVTWSKAGSPTGTAYIGWYAVKF